jgi:hypothetical protein
MLKILGLLTLVGFTVFALSAESRARMAPLIDVTRTVWNGLRSGLDESSTRREQSGVDVADAADAGGPAARAQRLLDEGIVTDRFVDRNAPTAGRLARPDIPGPARKQPEAEASQSPAASYETAQTKLFEAISILERSVRDAR